MIGAVANHHRELDRTIYPDYKTFAGVCRNGLSEVYPLAITTSDDPWGWKYGTGWPPSYWAFGRMRSLLAIQEARGLLPQKVLEVAAGGGGLAACLAATGCDVTANDLRDDLLAEEVNEYTSKDKIRLIGGNMFDLSTDHTGKFDLIIACEVIEHVAHPNELLAHLKKMLLPGGRLLLTTPNGSHQRNKLPTYLEISDFNELEKRQFMPDADGHLFLFTPQEFYDLAVSAGLQVERLNVWGTPLLSGHYGLRYLAGRLSLKIAYQAELLAQRLPSRQREQICLAMTAVLQLPA